MSIFGTRSFEVVAMKRLALLLALWFAYVPGLHAGTLPLLGAGLGAPAVVASFQGPGDIVSGALIWGSCARVFNASLATTATSLCDLKDATTGTVSVCTLRGSSTGFVDLTGSYCVGSLTPTAACVAAAGGACKVSKVYDQTGTGNFWSTATAAAMPTLTFSALNGLPGIQCAGACVFPTPSITQSQPFSVSYVAERTGNLTTAQNVLSTSGGVVRVGFSASTNTATIVAGSAITATASDSAFHATQGVINGASSSLVIDGSATTGNAGTNVLSNPVNLATANGSGASLTGIIMEVGIWPSAFNATQYGNLNTNQHGTSGYNF